MSQQINVLAIQARQPDFHPQSPGENGRKELFCVELGNLCPPVNPTPTLASVGRYTHTPHTYTTNTHHTHIHTLIIPLHKHIDINKN